MPLRDVARPDVTRYAHAIEVSILGERAAGARRLARGEPARRRASSSSAASRTRRPAHVVYDFVDHARPPFADVRGTEPPVDLRVEPARADRSPAASAATRRSRPSASSAPAGVFFNVGVTVIADEEFRPRRCLWSHPFARGEIVTRFHDVPLGQRDPRPRRDVLDHRARAEGRAGHAHRARRRRHRGQRRPPRRRRLGALRVRRSAPTPAQPRAEVEFAVSLAELPRSPLLLRGGHPMSARREGRRRALDAARSRSRSRSGYVGLRSLRTRRRTSATRATRASTSRPSASYGALVRAAAREPARRARSARGRRVRGAPTTSTRRSSSRSSRSRTCSSRSKLHLFAMEGTSYRFPAMVLGGLVVGARLPLGRAGAGPRRRARRGGCCSRRCRASSSTRTSPASTCPSSRCGR